MIRIDDNFLIEIFGDFWLKFLVIQLYTYLSCLLWFVYFK